MSPQTVRLYALAIAAAKIGTGLFFLINTWLLIDITGRPSSAAIALVMTVLPGILVSPFLGVLVDRGRPARMAAVADMLRWAVLVGYAVAYRLGWASAEVGYGVSFCVSLGNELQVIAWRTAIGRGASSEQVFRLNALTVVGGQTGQVLGAAVSGFALAAWGATPTVLLASASFLTSAVFGFAVARRLEAVDRPGTEPRLRSLRIYANELRDGVEHLLQRPQIAFFYALIVANLTVIFGINGLLAPFVHDELGLGPEAFGKIDAGYAVGAIGGGLLIVRWSRRLGRRAVLLGSFVLASASLWTFAHAMGLLVSLVAYAGLGLSFQANVISLSAAQQATAPHFQGRVNASFSLVSGLVGLALYGLIAVCAAHHWLRQFYLAQAVTMAVLFVSVALSTRPGGIGDGIDPDASGRKSERTRRFAP